MLKFMMMRRAPSLERLRKWNVWLAVAYGLQAVAVLVVGSPQLAPVNTTFLTIDSLLSSTSGTLVLAPATHRLFDLNLLYVAFAVMAILAVVHGSQASWYRTRYERQLQQSQDRLRWAAYGASASLTFITLAILVGITDVSVLLLLIVLSAILHGLCAWVERSVSLRGRSKANAWAGYGFMVLAGLAMWAVIVLSVAGANIYGGGQLSTRIYVLGITAAVTALSFAVGLYRQIVSPKTGQTYRLSDQRYMILMFVTSSLLVWQVVAGTMH